MSTLSQVTTNCPRPGHEGHRVRKNGSVVVGGEKVQRYDCLSETGERHSFTEKPVRPRVPAARCPEPLHQGSSVVAKGFQEHAGQRWQRFQCSPLRGKPHRFQVLIDAGTTAQAGAPSIHFPPACPEHAGSTVRRAGFYGKGPKARQRYSCVPADGSKPHTFTPPLSREVVDYGHEDCATCEELLSPHRGALTGARHTPWQLAIYARALSDLSLGASYSSVSIGMRAARAHLAGHSDRAELVSSETVFVGDRPLSHNTQQGKTSWHLAGDLVEQYSPLIFEHTMKPVREREARQRQRNDDWAKDHPGDLVPYPITYVLDEVPIWTRDKSTSRRSKVAWTILAAVEVTWRPSAASNGVPIRENRLRLARGYGTGDTAAWRLLLDELGTRPDVIVADASEAIASAVRAQYGPNAVTVMPSLYHLHRNIRATLINEKLTSTLVEGYRVPRQEVAKFLDVLNRDQLSTMSDTDWGEWWDGLITAVAVLEAPVDRLIAQRRVYEHRVLEALPLLREQPHLPASNAAIENRFRSTLEPFLANRKHLFRNVARTNALLDLAVARAHGAFTNPDDIARLIRADNEKHGGWAPAPRSVTDPQPFVEPGAKHGRQRYSSLRSASLVADLAKQRLTPPSSPSTSSAALQRKARP
ncbi:hypothetical protein [Janibacter sp. G368]|uniref:hypothetical protein n=1 Tax=Janibacter sp. G368 TaxID=3420441 RepID=UPI003CFFA48F